MLLSRWLSPELYFFPSFAIYGSRFCFKINYFKIGWTQRTLTDYLPAEPTLILIASLILVVVFVVIAAAVPIVRLIFAIYVWNRQRHDC